MKKLSLLGIALMLALGVACSSEESIQETIAEETVHPLTLGLKQGLNPKK